MNIFIYNKLLKFLNSQNSFQKTENALKTTATFFDEIGNNITSKFTQMKKSDSYKSIEDKVGKVLSLSNQFIQKNLICWMINIFDLQIKVGSRSESTTSLNDSQASSTPNISTTSIPETQTI